MSALKNWILWKLKIGWTYLYSEMSLHCASDIYRNNRTGELRWEHNNE